MIKKGVKVQGMDLALTHSAVVELTDGEMTDFWYLTNNKTSFKKGGTEATGLHARLLDVKKIDDKQQMHMARLNEFTRWLKWIFLHFKPDYAGIEDYALKADNYAHLKGEIGGQARIICKKNGVPFRLHDPLSVKLFTAGKGNAKKPDMEAAVMDEYGVDFSEYNKSWKDRTTSEDLCDAYAIAKMVWLEYQLRHGLIELKDLSEEKIRVFNRVTKSYPVNILGREWIQ